MCKALQRLCVSERCGKYKSLKEIQLVYSIEIQKIMVR